MTTLFRGGLIFDGKGQLLEQHGLLIEKDRIKTLAPISEFHGYQGHTVDTTDQTLMPGLTDCHVHLCGPATADSKATLDKMTDADITLLAMRHARELLENGITSVRDCGGIKFLEFAVRDAINRGEFAGPTIHAAGQFICMTGGHGHTYGRVADGQEDVIRAVREQIHVGADMIKIMATGGVMTQGVNPEDAHYSPEEIRAGIQEARRFNKRTASHAQGRDGILNAVRGGIHSIEHGIFMDQTCCSEMKAEDVYLVPTLSALRNIVDHEQQGIPDYIIEKVHRIQESHKRAFQLYYREGGKIAMGTDVGTPFNLHKNSAMELKYMTDFGMSTVDALVCGTANGADLMGIEDQGTITENNRADFLIVSGNPVEDIMMAADARNHQQVYKNGKPLMAEPRGL